MSYGWDPARQADVVFLCLGLGFLAGFFRDVLKYLRVLFSEKPAVVFAEDVVFCLLWGIAGFFLSLLVCTGRVRFYMLAAQVCGFGVWHFLPGALTGRLFARCKSLWGRTVLAGCGRLASVLKKTFSERKKASEKEKQKKAQKKKKKLTFKSNNFKKKTCNHQKNSL